VDDRGGSLIAALPSHRRSIEIVAKNQQVLLVAKDYYLNLLVRELARWLGRSVCDGIWLELS
jgi:hypothetical protein